MITLRKSSSRGYAHHGSLENWHSFLFTDYKEHVIDLLRRVTMVSVETQRIAAAMP